MRSRHPACYFRWASRPTGSIVEVFIGTPYRSALWTRYSIDGGVDQCASLPSHCSAKVVKAPEMTRKLDQQALSSQWMSCNEMDQVTAGPLSSFSLVDVVIGGVQTPMLVVHCRRRFPCVCVCVCVWAKDRSTDCAHIIVLAWRVGLKG